MDIYPVGALIISTDTRYRLRSTILVILNNAKTHFPKPLVLNTATHEFG